MSPTEIRSCEVKRILEVKTILINNLHKRYTIQELAVMAAMSREKFREVFRNVIEVMYWDYVREMRMRLGYFLLCHTNKPIKEVAYATGFHTSENFSTAFRKFYKITPGMVKRC